MKSTPILFTGEMVRAILDGRKTQTRRLVKPQPRNRIVKSSDDGQWYDADCVNPGVFVKCPYGQPGDRLWVKETFCADDNNDFCFRADEWVECPAENGKWKPSIFCTRKASRITLEIVSVRVERLSGISEDDAISEGITWPEQNGKPYRPPIDLTGISSLRVAANRYSELWESINGKGSWAKNPWVWVLEFKRITT